MAAPQFPANAYRHDPYHTFKFQVLIEGKPVAGFRKMSAVKKNTDVVEWRTGGDPSYVRKLSGVTKYEALTLEQGLSHDPVFQQWAHDCVVNNIDSKDVVINILNLKGVVAMSYQIKHAWVSEYQALPDFDAGASNTVSINTIKLEYEDLYRDEAVSEPSGLS